MANFSAIPARNFVEQRGIEHHGEASEVDVTREAVEDVDTDTTEASGPKSADAGPVDQPLDRSKEAFDAVEEALAKAITAAVGAGRFDVVAQLARELEARRMALASNVVALPVRRRSST